MNQIISVVTLIAISVFENPKSPEGNTIVIGFNDSENGFEE